MTIIFLHGWTSSPGGRKPTYLKDHGHTVLNPALPDNDLDAAVRITQAEEENRHSDGRGLETGDRWGVAGTRKAGRARWLADSAGPKESGDESPHSKKKAVNRFG